MRSNKEMIDFHIENQEVINTSSFESKEDYVLYKIHTYAYEQAARLAANKIVLDLGCNVGYGSIILSSSARRVIGVDVSAKVIQNAKNQSEGNNLTFYQIDGSILPFSNDEFDLIISCQVIEHIVDYENYFVEILRVLKPDGIVIFTTPNAAIRLDPGMKPWYEFHTKEFNSSELELLLKEYFSTVVLYGLFAEEPIYSIEFQRVTSIKENARGGCKLQELRQIIKKYLPEGILKMARDAIKHLSFSDSRIENSFLNEKFINILSSKKLFYRRTEIDDALDLLAICSNKNGSVEDLHDIFTKSLICNIES